MDLLSLLSSKNHSRILAPSGIAGLRRLSSIKLCGLWLAAEIKLFFE